MAADSAIQRFVLNFPSMAGHQWSKLDAATYVTEIEPRGFGRRKPAKLQASKAPSRAQRPSDASLEAVETEMLWGEGWLGVENSKLYIHSLGRSVHE